MNLETILSIRRLRLRVDDLSISHDVIMNRQFFFDKRTLLESLLY